MSGRLHTTAALTHEKQPSVSTGWEPDRVRSFGERSAPAATAASETKERTSFRYFFGAVPILRKANVFEKSGVCAL